MAGDRLPSLPGLINKYSPKYELCTLGFTKESLRNTKITIPLCLNKCIYQYALYFKPVEDAIKSLPQAIGFRYFERSCDNDNNTDDADFSFDDAEDLSLDDAETNALIAKICDDDLFDVDDDINILIAEICDAILPFTEQKQRQCQLPFDFINECSNLGIGNTLIQIINNAHNCDLISNIIWIMVQLDLAHNKVSKWADLAALINFSRIFSYFKDLNDIQNMIWQLLKIISDDVNKKDMIAIKTLNKINIGSLMFQELNKLNVRSEENYKCIHLQIIMFITKTFENIVINENACNIDKNICVRIIELVLFKMIEIREFIQDSEDKLYSILFSNKMENIIINIMYNVIKSLSYLIQSEDDDFIYTLLASTHILTHENIIYNYINLLSSYHSKLRYYVQKIIIKVLEYEADGIVYQQFDLLQQYVRFGLIPKLSSIFTESTNNIIRAGYIHMHDEEIDNYLAIIQNILSHETEFSKSIVLDTSNDAIMHWLFLLVDKYEDWIALTCIDLIANQDDIDVFERMIKFENGSIFKIFHNKLAKYMDNINEHNKSQVIKQYIPGKTGHIYIVLILMFIFINNATKIKHENDDNDTELTKFIYDKIDTNKTHLFINDFFPILCEKVTDRGLFEAITFLQCNDFF